MPGLARTTIGDHELPSVEHAVLLRAGVTLAAMLVAATPARGQETPPLMTREVVLDDFGIRRVTEVGRGRVSVVFLPEGPRLDVHYLLEPAPRGAPGVSPSRGPSAEPVLVADPAAPLSDGRPRRDDPLSALWVWSTQEILDDAGTRADFLDFVEQQGIDRVFLQVVPAAGEHSVAGFIPFDGPLLGRLVAELRARGALTYALDGDPRYVRPENRDGVLGTVARVAEHNRRAPPEERFLGVRYDVEPYLLPGFQSPKRAEIFANYLGLLEALSSAARESGLTFGVDIPFWLDALDEVTGKPFEALVGGARVPVLGRVLKLADDVAVMAYRTVADGPDGVVAHAGGEVTLAAGEGVDVFVGLETTELPDERRFTFGGAGRNGLPGLSDARWIVLEERPDGGARVWLVEGADALAALEEATRDARSVRYWFAGTPVPLPGSVLSFHSLGPEAMRRVAVEVAEGFQSRATFRGIAYHDYRGLRDLLGLP